MNIDNIIIRGAKENNLKNIDLDVSKGKITVFVGVSGSGKSSLVFDTIAVESRRQLQETFPAYVRNRMPCYSEPKVEMIRNLTPAIVIDQQRNAGDVRSTVGTITEVSNILRVLYSRFSSKTAGAAATFSFNDPEGMCHTCSGLGKIVKFDMKKVVDTEKSLNEGAINLPGFQINSYQWQMYANSGLFDNDKPLKEYGDEEWEEFLHGKDHIVDIRNNTGKVWDESYKLTYEGLEDRIDRLYLKKRGKNISKTANNILKNYTVEEICPDCRGKRLNTAALESRFMGYSIWDLGELEISNLLMVLEQNNEEACMTLVNKAKEILKRICDIGLGYLNLNRISSTLSGGEMQRLKIVRNLGSSLTGMTYIFDEPSTGLHPNDISRINEIFIELKNCGNTVIIVEHDKRIMSIADEIIEMGPGAGINGGKEIFRGDYKSLMKAETPTGEWLRNPVKPNLKPREVKKWITLLNCQKNNLKGFSVKIPCNVMTVITGVAGSGKSSLACEELPEQIPGVVHISQAPVGNNSRSTLASYMGVFDEIRQIYGKLSKEGASLFSFNSKGACHTCGGKGVIVTEMAFMDPVTTICDSCEGTRYNARALSYKYKGMNIAEIMQLTVAEAMDFFDNNKIRERLQRLMEVGLGYLALGQPTPTLSGGESQRLKLAAHLKDANKIYVMDEPTTGLHGKDIRQLLNVLDKLVDRGNTVVVVEHDFDVIKRADWVIDLGPGGGKNGGQIAFEGLISELIKNRNSTTGECMRKETEVEAHCIQ